jgi:hypothetical protein|tara:strand:- start:3892 stop:4608 length:717 start_codon:yes stop_codon:yes gene_type:complete
MKLKLLDGENQEMYFAQNRARCVRMLCAMLAFLLSLSLTKTASGKDPVSRTAVYSQITVSGLSGADSILAERAVYSCKCASRTYEKAMRSLRNARRLLAVERRQKIPEFMIGMTLAAACSESCFNEKAKGDHKFSKKGKAKAIGILQLWPWVKKYGVNRQNLESSAVFWLTHVKRQLKKIKKICNPSTKTRAWRQAWVTAVRSPKKGGRCRETVKHWRRFLKIQKLKKDIQTEEPGGC